MNAPLSKEQIALLMSDSLTLRDVVLPGTDRTVAEPNPGLVARMVASIANRMRQHRILGELRMLTDRELADIGLHRADLGRVFDPAFARARDQAARRRAMV